MNQDIHPSFPCPAPKCFSLPPPGHPCHPQPLVSTCSHLYASMGSLGLPSTVFAPPLHPPLQSLSGLVQEGGSGLCVKAAPSHHRNIRQRKAHLAVSTPACLKNTFLNHQVLHSHRNLNCLQTPRAHGCSQQLPAALLPVFLVPTGRKVHSPRVSRSSLILGEKLRADWEWKGHSTEQAYWVPKGTSECDLIWKQGLCRGN